MKRTEWRKFVDYFGRSIDADPSRVVRITYIFVYIGSIPITSSRNPHITEHQMYKLFDLEPPKLRLHQSTKKVAAKIAYHISSALRYLGVDFEKYVLSSITKLEDSGPAGTL